MTAASDRPGNDFARALAQAVERWSSGAGAAPDDARAAAAAAHSVAQAMADGHVCIELSRLGDAAAARTALLASKVVGRGGAPGTFPLVLDDAGRLYLQRYYDYECRLALRLLRARRPDLREPDGDVALMRGALDAHFGSTVDGSEPDWQKLAAALALQGRLTVISGGPGTGKTTTVVALLACLLARDPGCRIALAAPTGKAAARMTEAIAQRAARLPEAIRSAMPRDAATVHRLLEAGPRGFGRHGGNPLAVDMLVVDEASMLDLALATRLLEAVPDAARIVLLGDKDQLAAVESGSVFAELSADATLSQGCRATLAALTGIAPARIVPPAPAQASVLHDSAIWLRRSYRFGTDSAIARLAAAIREGSGALALAEAGPMFGDASAALDFALQGHAAFLDTVREGAPAEAVHAAFARFRVLAALREGRRGAVALNAEIEQRFRAALGPLDHAPRSPWYPGRPVLVRRNDAVARLFNGDIGIALPGDGGAVEVVFAGADGGLRRIAPARLPEHETAFAMTVHKAQGSEFDTVLVVLPERDNRVLSRELLYTAVTRARSGVRLWASEAVLVGAVGATTPRHSGLLARLEEASAQAIAAPVRDAAGRTP